MRAPRQWIPALICTAAALSVLNWSTTCCCGRSLLLELVEGGCECGHHHQHLDRDHDHAAAHQHSSDHDGCHGNSCLKVMRDWNTEESDSDLAISPYSVAVASAAAPTDRPVAMTRGAQQARCGPHGPPVFLLQQRLLL